MGDQSYGQSSGYDGNMSMYPGGSNPQGYAGEGMASGQYSMNNEPSNMHSGPTSYGQPPNFQTGPSYFQPLNMQPNPPTYGGDHANMQREPYIKTEPLEGGSTPQNYTSEPSTAEAVHIVVKTEKESESSRLENEPPPNESEAPGFEKEPPVEQTDFEGEEGDSSVLENEPSSNDNEGSEDSGENETLTDRTIQSDEFPNGVLSAYKDASKPEMETWMFPSGSYIGQVSERRAKKMQDGRKRPFVCTVCGKAFTRSAYLAQHVMIHTGEKNYKCELCDKSFVQKSSLTSHLRLHSGETPYDCLECGKSFHTSSNLAKHMRIHIGEKTYKCDVCGKGFVHSSNLNSHMKIHSGEKNHVCEYCHKTFRQSCHLVQHLKRHTGERNFTCPTCNHSFSQAPDLTKHMRIHSGEMPYKCTVCEKLFRHSSNLAMHMRTHSGDKPHECPVCAKTFSISSNMTRHMRTHTGEKPFPCRICDKSFAQTSHLASHMKTTHPGEKHEKRPPGRKPVNPLPPGMKPVVPTAPQIEKGEASEEFLEMKRHAQELLQKHMLNPVPDHVRREVSKPPSEEQMKKAAKDLIARHFYDSDDSLGEMEEEGEAADTLKRPHDLDSGEPPAKVGRTDSDDDSEACDSDNDNDPRAASSTEMYLKSLPPNYNDYMKTEVVDTGDAPAMFIPPHLRNLTPEAVDKMSAHIAETESPGGKDNDTSSEKDKDSTVMFLPPHLRNLAPSAGPKSPATVETTDSSEMYMKKLPPHLAGIMKTDVVETSSSTEMFLPPHLVSYIKMVSEQPPQSSETSE